MDNETQQSSSNKTIPIVVAVIIIILLGGFLFYQSKSKSSVLGTTTQVTPTASPTKPVMKPAMGMGRPMASVKGTKLADNKMLAPHAYLVYPINSPLPADTQKAISGWKVTSTQNSDGSATVSLTPDNSEQEEHAQQFTVKSGEKLYYVELNLNDDVNGQDELYFDDIGILVDQNGIIQNDLPKPPTRGQRPSKQPGQ